MHTYGNLFSNRLNMTTKQYPFYLKSTVILVGLVTLCFIFKNLQDIMSPLAFAFLLAILLNPLVNKLQKYKIPHIPAIIVTMLLATVVFLGIFYFLSSQIMHFGENIPELKVKLNSMLGELQHWLQSTFNISIKKQLEMLDEAVNSNKAVVGQTLSAVLSTLSVVLLVPVYVFLFLFYKNLMLNFVYEMFAEKNTTHVREVLDQSKSAIQSYMVGLLLEATVVAILNSTALLILGVKYAILLGIIGAILNVLPYIGGLIAIALPVLIATMTEDGYSTQLGIVIAYLIIQFIDNNFLVPRIVSSKVQINALFSIIIVLMGGALWGISGMFLSIPLFGILKIIFGRIEELKPWGKLLGDEIPTSKDMAWLKMRRRRPAAKTGDPK
jgi:predicted PurR-regulated permease PerM